jgi:hypothetical protein
MPDDFAIRVDSIASLFNPFDARPVRSRRIADEVREYLLDEWDRLRDDEPAELVLHAPRAERDDTDEDAVRVAICDNLRRAAEPRRRGERLPRSQKVSMRVGLIFLFLSIAISTVLDQNSDDVIVQGISQAIVVAGWVALWAPAAYFALEVAPHAMNRRRFREFAEIPVRFVWD